MALEKDLAEGSTTSHAASTNHVSQNASSRPSENLKCPNCLDTINDRASKSCCRHPFSFCSLVEWFHRRAACSICQQHFPHNFHTVGDTNSEVYSTGKHSSSTSHAQGGRAGLSSEERSWHRSSGCQHHSPYRTSRGGTRGGSHGGTRGGSRGGTRGGSRGGTQGGSHGGTQGSSHGGTRGGSRGGTRGSSRGGTRGSSRGGTRRGARERSRSRYQRRHRNGHSRGQQAQGYNRSSRSRQQQNRAHDNARGKRRAPRTKQRIRTSSGRSRRHQQELQVSFMEPRVTRSRFRRRSHSTERQTLRENLRRMERDEGQALRHEWYIHTSSRRNQHRQHRSLVSYREPQVISNRSRRRSHRTRCQTLPENPRRIELDEGHFLRTKRAVPASSRRRRHRQQGHQVVFIEPQVTRSQNQGMPRRTRRQTLREKLRRMERDEGRALRLERYIPTSSGWNEHHQQSSQISFTELEATRN